MAAGYPEGDFRAQACNYPSPRRSSTHRSATVSHFKATKKALEGDAKRKYFEHAGALMTADGSACGSDDHLIKLEGTPPGYKLVIPPPDQ